MSTDDQFAAGLRRIADGLEAPTPVDPDALAAVAVRRTRRRRVVVPTVSALAVIALATTVAFALPDAGRTALPGGGSSPSATTATSPAPEASAPPEPTPTPSRPVDPFTYEASNVPDGWKSVGATGLALAVPEGWGGGLEYSWMNAAWWDTALFEALMDAARQANAEFRAEHGRDPEVDESAGVLGTELIEVRAYIGTYSTADPLEGTVLEERDLMVPGADSAHLVVTDPHESRQPGTTFVISVHQEGGLWYTIDGQLPAGAEGLDMARTIAGSLRFVASAEEIHATLPSEDHLPVLELPRGIPAGWIQHDKNGLGYALPAAWAVNTQVFAADDPAVADWRGPDPVTPTLAGSLTITWSRNERIPTEEPDPATRRLTIDGASLATTLWSERDWGVDPWGGESTWPAGTMVLEGNAIVERADGDGYYWVAWTLPAGSEPFVEQFLGTLEVRG
ncbi:hypothetical protein L1785_09480 [Antribacter sp. KLBMP9083]|uniref:DUF4367 domain-containing protein n=1 Tax=Antribacter soli TaxID=2910976 RepID=A0AA41U6N0_9MICO|nr:hypothetical protein [Antribacter soli]MCF4121213.1 hypothetical protein [Antribacter soli]